MQVDYALILSAGLGTRMGEIGKVLPKVMWPIFSKTLLQLQIEYCRNLGIENIYINVHFLANEIIEHIKTIPKDKVNITILHEDPLLDSGGAIHNLAKRNEVNYQGNLLLVNGDQFLFFDQSNFTKAFRFLERADTRAVLFGITVDKSEKYNETIIENDLLVEIQIGSPKNQRANDYVTYSGLGFVKLDGLRPVDGPSKFFETVVNYRFEKAYMVTPSSFEYWDFGTAEIYCKNIFKIAKTTDEKAYPLLKKFLSIASVDFHESKDFVNVKINSIDLDRQGRFQHNMLISKNIFQTI